MALEKIEISQAKTFRGEFTPPPDKSISHRAVILSSLAKGKGIVKNFLRAKDTESTMNAFRALGVEIMDEGDTLTIYGKGLYGLSEPAGVLDCGNSGTTIRLVSGVLSGSPFFSVLTGDDSLRTRPMGRVIAPLSRMGAEIMARSGNRYPPVAIKGAELRPLRYTMPVASAQVKSSLLLAGLYCTEASEITEPTKSRDHTERMLPAFGADVRVEGLRVTVKGGRELSPMEIEVPGDFSSAAFFIVAALLVPGSEIICRNVGINPTRTGLLEALRLMGAKVEIINPRTISGEPVADIHCGGKAALKAVHLAEGIIPSLIDEFPVLCVAATAAEGFTTIRGASELRVKESDRIKAMASELGKMGVKIEEYPDGIGINGTAGMKGTEVESHGDHRIAMAMTVAALTAEGTTTIYGSSVVDISFPAFFDSMRGLSS
jgi:3-phosphoshikimate 1-carboxyvinyltransferase